MDRLRSLAFFMVAVFGFVTSMAFAQSIGFSHPTVIHAIKTASQATNGGAIKPTTQKQRDFLKNHEAASSQVLPLIEKYIESMVTNNSSKMNNWLRNKGFTITMNIPPQGLGVASVTDLLVDWLEPGSKSEITAKNGKKYPAVKMKDNQSVEVYQAPETDYPIIVLKTRQGIDIQIVETDKNFRDSLEIYTEISKILAYGWKESSISEIRFPMIDLQKTVDVGWLKGLQAGNFFINEAKKEIMFRMNEKGAHAKAAVAFTARGISRSYRVKRSFILWITTADQTEPIFTLFCDYDSWKEPQKL